MVISVVTTVLNKVGSIAVALESVRRQVLSPGVAIEHVVVDAVSTDGTLDIIRKFAREAAESGRTDYTLRYVSEPDHGIYDGINKGIAIASGDVVGLLHSDDALADDNVIADVAAAFSKNVEAVYCDVRFVRGGHGGSLDDFRSLPTSRFYSSAHWHRWMHHFGYMPAHTSLYVRKDALHRVGPYATNFKISGDFEWMVRAFCGKRGERPLVRPVYLRRTVVIMSQGGASTGGLASMCKLNCENVQANRNNGYPSCILMMLPKYLFKIWGCFFVRRHA